MPPATKPQLALYAAFAIAVLLIGARFLRAGDDGGGSAGSGAVAPIAGGVTDGAPDGSAAGGEGGAGPAGSTGRPGSVGGIASPDAAGSASGAAGGALVVDVKGAVRRPGVYRLPAGARALDAVRRAGGVTGRADRLRVNLAARVTDGGEVVVPRRGEPGSSVGGSGAGSSGATAGAAGGSGGAGGAGAGGSPGTPLALDINTASAQELEQLDGVGPATAAKIVAYREQHGGFASIDELDEVSGIGEAKLAAIRAQLGQ